MKKIMLFLVLFALICFKSFAQNYHELNIGDHVPDITIRGFYDDDKKAVKISELYRHKLLVLDFWGTWCGSCLNEMQTFPALKKEYGNKLNIVAVGYETKERIAGLFKRNAFYHNPKWTTLYGDKLLTYKLFPHHTLPHLVWIDSTGRVSNITSGDYFTKENITRYLKGAKIDARTKIDNDNYSLAVMDRPFRQMDTMYIGRSILTHQMIGGGLGFTTVAPYSGEKHPLLNRSYIGNLCLWDLYYRAVFPIDANTLNKERLIFEIKDSLRWTTPKEAPESFKKSRYKNHDEWADSNAYCYDLVLPKKVSESTLRSYMLSDLNRFLNFNGRWEERERPCYAIQDLNNVKSENDVLPVEGTNMFYKDDGYITFEDFISLINKRIRSSYVFNESNFKKDAILNIKTNVKQTIKPEEISFILHQIGLKLVSVRRKVPVYVVSEY
jgi:thiol-disulfide isomerase/thioredoxin